MLLEQLEVTGLSHQLLSNKYESDVITLTQQAETLQSKSNTEAQTHELVAQCEEMPEDVGCQEQQTMPDSARGGGGRGPHNPAGGGCSL